MHKQDMNNINKTQSRNKICKTTKSKSARERQTFTVVQQPMPMFTLQNKRHLLISFGNPLITFLSLVGKKPKTKG